MVVADMVEGPVEGVTDEEVMEAMNKMKLGKAAGPSKVHMDTIIASGKFGVGVVKKICQRVLDGKGMPEEWKTSVVVPIFKRKGGVMKFGAYREVKLLEHAMKVVERVLENRIRGLVTIDDMQFGFMSGKDTTHALFILLDLHDLLIYNVNDGSYRVESRRIPLNPKIKNRQMATWNSFLGGNNSLRKRFTIWNDIQALLNQYRQPSVEEGKALMHSLRKPLENVRARMRQHSAGRYEYTQQPVSANTATPSRSVLWTVDEVTDAISRQLN